MYSIEQFIELSPSEAHSEDVLSDEHQLTLNRLGFELVERQRFNEFLSATIGLTHAHFARLDRKVKELAQEKEELLKSSKSQAATTESVKTQIETLLKVALTFPSCPENPLSVIFLPDRVRNRQEGRRACSCYYKHTP
jgi:THO complex subunit 5